MRARDLERRRVWDRQLPRVDLPSSQCSKANGATSAPTTTIPGDRDVTSDLRSVEGLR